MPKNQYRLESIPFQTSDPLAEYKMVSSPRFRGEWYKGSGKLAGKVVLLTGGDSGIGRAVAIFFAREGAKLAIGYYNEHQDATDTKKMVAEEGGPCLLLPGDVGDPVYCNAAVADTVKTYGKLDILINNAAYEKMYQSLEDLPDENLELTFRTNIFSHFYMTRAALKYLKAGAAIINTTSVTAYTGHPALLDYAATKGAIVAFTRSLALSLAERNIRVNAIAPGPVWTPLVASGMKPEQAKYFGKSTPMQRGGQPEDLAPAYVFLASQASSYMTGQVLHVDGGTIVNG